MFTRREAVVGALGTSLAASCASSRFPQGPAEFRAAKKFVTTESGLRMAYFEAGRGAPIVFLHGNPTSSYLWRKVIPHLTGLGRCIAPDMIGMGDSDKLPQSGPNSYSFFEHLGRLDSLLDAVGADRDVTLVLHDWGGPLGFHWAMRNEARVRGIAFMETFVVSQDDTNTPPQALEFFAWFRTGEAEREVLMNNAFVETVLLRQFPDMPEQDRAEYRRPFVEAGESRRPTLDWPRQVPINGEPAGVHREMLRCLRFMSETQKPKLLIKAEPGGLIVGGRERVPRAWPGVSEVVAPGGHFVPEHSPDEVGHACATWLARVGLR